MKNSDLKEKSDHYKNIKNYFFLLYACKINNNYTYHQRNKERLLEKAKNRYHQEGSNEKAKA